MSIDFISLFPFHIDRLLITYVVAEDSQVDFLAGTSAETSPRKLTFNSILTWALKLLLKCPCLLTIATDGVRQSAHEINAISTVR